MGLMANENGEPLDFYEAINGDDREKWQTAMDEEYRSLMKNTTWLLTEPPKDRKILTSKWVFKIKTDSNGNLDTYKASLVIKGCSQRYGIDYYETFSPVVRYESIRAILSISLIKKTYRVQFDVKTAFLYGNLNENIFMYQPLGYDDKSGRVCLLKRSLYGLKQAPRCWNERFVEYIKRFEFEQNVADSCVFFLKKNEFFVIIALYVDDGLVISDSNDKLNWILNEIKTELEIKISDLNFYLGLEIKYLDDSHTLFISQSNYVNKVLDRFKMTDSKPVKTPIDVSNKIIDDVSEKEDHNFPYREVVGSLMYLAIISRPDIVYAVNYASRFVEKPLRCQVVIVKRILRYLNGTKHYGLWYGKESNMVLNCYSDSDFANDPRRKSISGVVVKMDKNVIAWASRKQQSVTLSTTESEYVAATECVKEMIWLKSLLNQLVEMNVSILYVDNQSTIKLIKNPEFHKRTKHIDVKYHFIREKLADNVFVLEYVPTDSQEVDVMTKPLSFDKFHAALHMLNLRDGVEEQI